MSELPTITWRDLNSGLGTGLSNEELWRSFILPITRRDKVPGRSQMSKLINCADDSHGQCNKFLKDMARTTQSPQSGAPYTYKNYPYLKMAEGCWQTYIDNHPEDQTRLTALVKDLCGVDYEIRIVNETDTIVLDLTERLQSIQNLTSELPYQLGVLSILATTWMCWEYLRTGRADDQEVRYLEQLARLILPVPIVKTVVPAEADPASPAVPDPIEERFRECVARYDRGEYAAAASGFEEIVTRHLTAPYPILADACVYLNKCYSTGRITDHAPIATKDELDSWAQRYGASVQIKTHDIRQLPQASQAPTSGCYIYNALDSSRQTQQIAQWIDRTSPAGWERLDIDSASDKGGLSFDLIDNMDVFAATLSASPVRFILINADPSRNIEDALRIIDNVHRLQTLGQWDASLSENLEIILRCPEAEAASVLDTACSYLDKDEAPVKIYLIDDHKRSADHLFARYPLFYPLTSSRNTTATAELALIIVSDNKDTAYTLWLIRDAFWMLPQRSPEIGSRIMVISPYASEIAESVTYECPGFAAFSHMVDKYGNSAAMDDPIDINIKDIAFPQIYYYAIAPNTRAWTAAIRTILAGRISAADKDRQDILPYIVVDAESDLQAMSTGQKIREIMIRDAVEAVRLERYSPDAAVVAIRTNHPDYAGLIKDLIVPKETEHDWRFFTDYRFITFGSIKDLYSWDQLTGGEIEFMAQCMHLQYCNGSAGHDFQAPAAQTDLWSYYYRLYNRSSSYAAAMSLPYRLFHAGIYPSTWVIANDDDIYWKEAGRKALAGRFNQSRFPRQDDIAEYKNHKREPIEDEDLIWRLARYEHTRWCCYMLSMGWLPSDIKRTEHYIDQGVSRQNLQIARLHACLCSWDELQDLYRDLHWMYQGTPDGYGHYHPNPRYNRFKSDNIATFQEIDLNNIRQTGDMLNAAPIATTITEPAHPDGADE